MIQRDPTLTEDAGKGPQPQTPTAAALTVVSSLCLAQQGGQNGQGGQGGHGMKDQDQQRKKKEEELMTQGL